MVRFGTFMLDKIMGKVIRQFPSVIRAEIQACQLRGGKAQSRRPFGPFLDIGSTLIGSWLKDGIMSSKNLTRFLKSTLARRDSFKRP